MISHLTQTKKKLSIKNRPETETNSNILIEPYKFKDIFQYKDKIEWLNAVKEELKTMKVYKIVKTVPSRSNITSSPWVFKYKRDANGNIINRKARLVTKGYTQQYGIDYKETFAPTLKHDTIWIIIVIAAQKNFNIVQIELIKISFNRIKSEPCVYIKLNNKKEIVCILSVYVDDILIAGTNQEINKVKKFIQKFNIKDIGDVEFVIGIKFTKTINGYILHQTRYINDIFNKFDINDLTPSKNLIPVINSNLQSQKFNVTKYRSAVGSLLYLAICSSPDILFAVSIASKNSTDPSLEDWTNVLKIFRYLKFTKDYGIKIEKGIKLKIYVDADFSGDSDTRKSTSGFLM